VQKVKDIMSLLQKMKSGRGEKLDGEAELVIGQKAA
jgi:hypothetical protein